MESNLDSVANHARPLPRAAAIALLTVLFIALSAMVIAVVLPPSPSGTSEPLIYVSGGKAYMARGVHKVRLDDASLISDLGDLNGEFSVDQSWLFYIANHDKWTGEGDLMRVATDGRHSPERLAQGVCSAVFSDDGLRVLYTSQSGNLYALRIGQGQSNLLAHGVLDSAISENGERVLYVCGTQDTGDLYSWDFSGNPEFIAGSVCAEHYKFSPNAENICYVVKSAAGGGIAQTAIGTAPASDTYTLFVKYGSNTPEPVDQNTTGAFDFFSYSSHLLDDDQLLYFGEDTLIGAPFHIFSPGSATESFPPYSMVFMVFSDNSFLFRSQGSMYYKAPGQAAELLSDNTYLLPFFGRRYYEMPPETEKRFLLMESDTAWDSLEYPKYATVYEQEIDKSKIKLCVADAMPLSISFNEGLTQLAYVRDGALYMMQKENSIWSDPVTVSDEGYSEIHIYEDAFDSSGQYLYYLKKMDEAAEASDLYRYSLTQGKSTFLLQDVHSFNLLGNVPYAVTAAKALYRMDTGERIAHDVRYVQEAEGGIHIFTETGIIYYDKDNASTTTLSTDAQKITAIRITDLPPLTDEIAAKLEELCADAQYCISVLENDGTGSFLDEYKVAKELNAREDVPPELHSILSDFLAGFANANSYSICIDEQIKLDQAEHYRSEAVNLLQSALQICREYLGDTGMR